jgi:hypothetical protein
MYDSPQMININPEFKSEPYNGNQIQTEISKQTWNIRVWFDKES